MTTDKELVKQRFGSGFKTYDKLAVVQQQICEELATACRGCVGHPVRSVLEVGIGTGFLTRRLVGIYPDAQWYLNDISEQAGHFVDKYVKTVDHRYLWGDAEVLVFPTGLDMVASASTMQWFDDPKSFVAGAFASTDAGGYLALTSFGPENFREIAAVAGEGLAYMSRAELETIITDAGYELLYANDYIRSLLFDSPSDVLHHIKATGVNSISKTRWTRGRLARFDSDYRERFSIADARVTLTYHPIFIIARKP